MPSSGLGVGRPSEGRGSAHSRGNHPRQSSSSVFNSFEPEQIKTFKEAFNVRRAQLSRVAWLSYVYAWSRLACLLHSVGTDSP